MPEGLDAQIKRELLSDIEQLEAEYQIVRNYLSGKDYDITEIQVSLKKFKGILSVASAHILTLYNLKGQKIRTIGKTGIKLDQVLVTVDGIVIPAGIRIVFT